MSLEKNINYVFSNKDLLSQAMLHPSFCNENKQDKLLSNQRLEFLGDAVVELIITDYLYVNFPNLDEGTLTRVRSFLVARPTLAIIAKELELEFFLVMAKSARKMNDHLRASTLCDSFEALVAAIYLDSSYEQAQQVVVPLMKPFIADALQLGRGNPKNLVQEYVQKTYQDLPQYRLRSVSGEAHDLIYIIDLYINDEYKTTGEGKNKKQAELQAAQKFLNLTNKDN